MGNFDANAVLTGLKTHNANKGEELLYDAQLNITASQRGWGDKVGFYTGLAWGTGARKPKPASRSLRRALLMPQVNTGSRYRCGKRT